MECTSHTKLITMQTYVLQLLLSKLGGVNTLVYLYVCLSVSLLNYIQISVYEETSSCDMFGEHSI